MLFCDDEMGITERFETLMESCNNKFAKSTLFWSEGALKIIAMDKTADNQEMTMVFQGLMEGILAPKLLRGTLIAREARIHRVRYKMYPFSPDW